MNRGFRRYVDMLVILFINDTLVYPINEEEHANYLRIALEMLEYNGLYAMILKYS